MGIFEFLYYIGYRLKKFYSLKRARALPSKVISIGNLTVGGTGKTPAVISIAKRLLDTGLEPCILTRGYKGKAEGPCFVSIGEGPLMSAEFAGDEPTLMAWKLRGVPIVKSSDRYEGGLFALRELKRDFVFILDDGYQHWALKRDIDILLIDSKNPFGSKKLLPIGILREPVSEIKRADIIVLTKTRTMPEGLLKEIRKYNHDAPIYCSYHKFSEVRRPSGEEVSVSDIVGKSAFAFAAIGEPESFLETLKEAGIIVKGFKAFRDHYFFKERDLRAIKEQADRLAAQWIITTEKDIIRLKEGFFDNLIVACIEFETEERFFEDILRRLNN